MNPGRGAPKTGFSRWRTASAALGAVVATGVVLTGCLGTSPASPVAETPSSQPSSEPSTPGARTPAPSATTSHPEVADHSTDERATALATLAGLAVKGRTPMTGYGRERFGQAWLDADRNGCDTRNDLLAARLTNLDYAPGTHDCVVQSGDLADHYTAREIHFVKGDGFLVDIDHVVALGNVWATGGSGWDIRKRAAIANDPMNLEPVDASTNRQKGDGDAATWLPPSKSYRCSYVARQIGVKAKYGLWVTPPEGVALKRVLAACTDEHLPKDSGAPTSVTLNIHDPYLQSTATSEPSPPSGSVHYANCDAARAAGAAPVLRGDPGYGPHLDRDGDGSACK